MSHNSHHKSRRRQSTLGLWVGIFVLAALAAQPLHLMEGHGDVVSSVSNQAEAHPTPGSGFAGSHSAPGERPFSSDDGSCLDCLALSITAVTGAWVAGPVASSPVPTASPPSSRPPMEFRGKADARPRAPPSA
jgi:hypothetical protein